MGALSQLPPGPLHCVLSGICDTVSQTVPEGWAGLSQTFNISLATVTWFSLQITNPHLPAKCQECPFHPSIVPCTPERCGRGRGPTAPRVFSSTEKWGNKPRGRRSGQGNSSGLRPPLRKGVEPGSCSPPGRFFSALGTRHLSLPPGSAGTSPAGQT